MSQQLMPAFFIGHGSPMNIIAKNSFTEFLQGLNNKIPRPKGILVISAHWKTENISYTAADRPRTIHDFGGFPPQLYQIQYPAPSDLWLESRLQSLLADENPRPEKNWGLDHGAWAILHHIYPNADIPVTQLSIPANRTYEDYFQIGQKISPLRSEGVLIVASGNIVHNLHEVDFRETSEIAPWAFEFDQSIANKVLRQQFSEILGLGKRKSDLFKMAHPTDEHFIPLLYVLGLFQDEDKIQIPFQEFQNYSISMTSIQVGS